MSIRKWLAACERPTSHTRRWRSAWADDSTERSSGAGMVADMAWDYSRGGQGAEAEFPGGYVEKACPKRPVRYYSSQASGGGGCTHSREVGCGRHESVPAVFVRQRVCVASNEGDRVR